METPGLTLAFNILEIVRYAVTVLCLLAAQAAVFAVIAFGYVAAAIAVLLGPMFIPFFIVPQMEWLFWGWLKSLIQYAFYPVVANAYLYVFGNLLIHFVDSHPPPYDGRHAARAVLPARDALDRLYLRGHRRFRRSSIRCLRADRANRPCPAFHEMENDMNAHSS